MTPGHREPFLPSSMSKPLGGGAMEEDPGQHFSSDWPSPLLPSTPTPLDPPPLSWMEMPGWGSRAAQVSQAIFRGHPILPVR